MKVQEKLAGFKAEHAELCARSERRAALMQRCENMANWFAVEDKQLSKVLNAAKSAKREDANKLQATIDILQVWTQSKCTQTSCLVATHPANLFQDDDPLTAELMEVKSALEKSAEEMKNKIKSVNDDYNELVVWYNAVATANNAKQVTIL